TGVAVLSLALGIGANAAIFSLYEQLLLRPLPVAAPDELVNLSAPGPKPGLTSCNQAGPCDDVLSYPMYRDLEREHPGFTGLAAHRAFGANLARGERTVSGEGMFVSGSYFPLLGVKPALGRLLQPADDRVPGEHPVVVLSHRFWRSQLGGDPDVLNSTVIVNGRPLTVVGVAARGFDGATLGANPDVFIPLTMRGELDPLPTDYQDRRGYWLYAFGRLAPGTSLRQAEAAINQLYTAIINDVEAELQEGMSEPTLATFREKTLALAPGHRGQSSIDDDSRTSLTLLFGITLLVLLIACANIANLLLARGAQRSTEMAIRGALGAGRGQLMRQLLADSLLLALVGGLASLAVARATLVYVGSILPDQPRATVTLELEPAVLVFTAVVTIATGLLFGLYPALHATRADLVTTLRSGSGQTGGRAAARFRTGLVTAQIALSMTLLVAAGLFIRSLANVSRVDLGIETERMVTFTIAPVLNGYEPDRSRVLFERLEEELAAVPGVTGVSAAMVGLLAGNSWGSSVAVQGFEGGPDVDNGARFNEIGPGFFRTTGTPLIAGREFTAADASGAPRVAIVNEAFAEKFGLARHEVVGALMSDQPAPGVELDMEIVGFVEDASYNAVREEVPPLFYTPYRQDKNLGFMNFYLRTAGDPTSVLRAIPAVVQRLDPNLPVDNLVTMTRQADESVFMDRMISILSAAFAVLATLLAAIGLYGVLAYTVAQRTREIGLRMALGAGRPAIRTMVLRQVGGMLAVGGLVGLAAAILVGRAARSLLYELQGHDPVSFAAAAILLAAVALSAGFIPALRASRVDPMRALRYG
ncbi:MAG: ABC transporter permease, partial [Gemmatimonadota bacterium]